MVTIDVSRERAASAARRGGLMILLLGAGALLALNSVACVKTGHVGVVTVFGKVTGRVIPEGMHLVNPLARVHELSIKTQEVKERAAVPSKEGLIMGLEASVLYHLNPDNADEVFQKTGANYADVLLVPRLSIVTFTVSA